MARLAQDGNSSSGYLRLFNTGDKKVNITARDNTSSYIANTGAKLGIGIQSPTHELGVVGDISATGNFYIQDISARKIYFTEDISGRDASFQNLTVNGVSIADSGLWKKTGNNNDISYTGNVFIDSNNFKTLIRFDKEDFLLAGWVSSDQYNNQIIFEIDITSTNQMMDDRIFTLPSRS